MAEERRQVKNFGVYWTKYMQFYHIITAINQRFSAKVKKFYEYKYRNLLSRKMQGIIGRRMKALGANV